MLALTKYLIFPMGFAIYIEIFLTGLLIALLGASGYVFFIYSMRDDRGDRIRKLYYNNPWEQMGKPTDEEEPKRPRMKKSTKIGILLLLAATVVLILLILVLNSVYSELHIS